MKLYIALYKYKNQGMYPIYMRFIPQNSLQFPVVSVYVVSIRAEGLY
jgi:hypothetical protein